MRLYLSEESIFKSKEQTGEHMGGTYVARVQTGIEKDGSPQYRYFRSQAEYNDYLREQRKKKQEGKKLGGKKTGEGKRSKKKNDKTPQERLKAKLKEEQERASHKTKKTPTSKMSEASAKKRSIFGKGMPLYIGDTDVE